MSSQEEQDSDVARVSKKSMKKRRIGRACDLCRQKKVRCDGEQRPGKRCTNCTAYDDECTYMHSAPKRRSRPKGYVEHLETRIAKMEELLEKLCPGADLQRDLDAALEESSRLTDEEHEADSQPGGSHIRLRSPSSPDTSFDYAIPPSLITHAPTHHATTYLPQLTDTPQEDPELESSDDELLTRQKINRHFGGIPLDHIQSDRRFFGKSSSFMIVQAAVDMKKDYHPDDTGDAAPLNKAAITFPPTPGMSNITYLPCGCPDYGNYHPWVSALLPYTSPFSGPFSFPPLDLLPSLVHLFFFMHNNYTPVLHRPTFDKMLAEGKHTVDEDFGSVVLLVCAIGSRWSKDRRVLLDEEVRADDGDEGEDEEEWHSAGWKWFKQVRLGRKALFSAPSLSDIQITCLAAVYLRGSSTSDASRTTIGIGLRHAQDIGAHRNKMYSSLPVAEGEMLKRTFWVLVWLDWAVSPQLGRPCGVQHEDFDLDLPVECDDDYWVQDESTVSFKQPIDKPSVVTFFNCFLRLNQIQAFAMRTIYSTTKSKTILGFVGPQWEERIVAELDSALNNWRDSVPQWLRWDPRSSDDTSLSQSAILYAAYCALQITIHRPFISYTRSLTPTPGQSTSRFPSLTICVNAARSCVHILDFLCKKFGAGSELAAVVVHYSLIPLFNCGIVLMLNMWGKAGVNKPGASRNGASGRDPLAEMKEMADVHAAMDMLKSIETRWHTAGRLWDMLYEMAVVGDLPLPSYSHASVIRSSNQKIMKAAVAKAAAGSPNPDQRSGRNPSHPVPIPSLERNGNPPPATRPPSLSSASADRTAMNQALYPRHAHLFRPPTDDPGAFNCDLSPSVFTRSANGADSQQPDPSSAGQRQEEDTQSIFSRGSEHLLHSDSMSRSKSEIAYAPPVYAHGNAAYPHPDIAPAPVSAPSDVSGNADWASFTTQLTRRPAVDSQSQSAPAYQADYASYSTSVYNSPPSTVGPVDMGSPEPPRTLRSFADPMAYHQSAASTTTATGYVTGMQDDSAMSRETLAMWSNVPPGFNWDDWGTYIDGIGVSGVVPGMPVMSPQSGTPFYPNYART